MALGSHENLEQLSAPSLFARGPSAFARLIFFATLSLMMMITDARLAYLAGVRQTVLTVLHPLQVIANSPVTLYRKTSEYVTSHHQLYAENKRLATQTFEQSVTLQKLNAIEQENQHLRTLLQANNASADRRVMGEIIYEGRDIFSKKIVVNRGKHHGVTLGEAVVDANGVIGQVTRVFPLTSEITLITDNSLAIPVQIERNGLRAIAFGRVKDNTLVLPYLPTNVDVQKGDRLVTSGIDGVYPPGLAVATVAQMDRSPDSPFARIICHPAGGVQQHRQVMLVRPWQADQADGSESNATSPAEDTASNSATTSVPSDLEKLSLP